jgi:D-arabinose 1-dehydrogenase-like Zn-dependent alcohol dehydrogenase
MSTNRIRSLRFAEFGPPSVLRIEEVAIAEPGEGEVLVRVKAAAINPSDIGNVAGRFKNTTLPRTPGRDFAGIVIKDEQHEGDEIWGSSPNLGIVHDGSHAEYVVVPAETLSLKPKSLQNWKLWREPSTGASTQIRARRSIRFCGRRSPIRSVPNSWRRRQETPSPPSRLLKK